MTNYDVVWRKIGSLSQCALNVFLDIIADVVSQETVNNAQAVGDVEWDEHTWLGLIGGIPDHASQEILQKMTEMARQEIDM